MADPDPKSIRIVVGLGNPGKEYGNTYHNAGFLFVDYLKNRPISAFRFPISNLLKSAVFMNESGGFVRKTLRKHGLRPENLLLVHDDSDIKIGKFKVSFGRGGAGHKGAESVIRALGTKNFWRLRIGIRPTAEPRGINADGREKSLRKSAYGLHQSASRKKAGLPAAARRAKAGDFVLKKISSKDAAALRSACEKISNAAIICPQSSMTSLAEDGNTPRGKPQG